VSSGPVPHHGCTNLFVVSFGTKKNVEDMRSLVELALKLVDSAQSVRYARERFVEWFRLSSASVPPRKNKWTKIANRWLRYDHSLSSSAHSEQRLEKRLKDAQVEEASRKKQEKAEKEKQREKEEYDRLSAAAKEKRDLKNEKKKRQDENSKLFKVVKK
jgi:hypothetical protein